MSRSGAFGLGCRAGVLCERASSPLRVMDPRSVVGIKLRPYRPTESYCDC